MRAAVTLPVIASGGAGARRDFPPAVAAGADAVLAASVFHFGDLRRRRRSRPRCGRPASRCAEPYGGHSPPMLLTANPHAQHLSGTLRMDTARTETTPSESPLMSAATIAPTATATKRRVLVVDDEDNVTHLVSSALRFDGFETVTADNGTAALAEGRRDRPGPDRARRDDARPRRARACCSNLRAAGSPGAGHLPDRARRRERPRSSGCAPAPTTTS